ncbi:Hypothetical predicted protein, partial [Paramuricea clavata]
SSTASPPTWTTNPHRFHTSSSSVYFLHDFPMLRPPCTRPVHVYPSYLLRWSSPVFPFLWLSTHVSSSGRRMVLAAVCHVDAL